MKTLEEIKEQFEDKTVGGYEFNILAYHPDQEYPIIVEVRNEEVWETTSFRSCGKISDDYYITWNLVKKKKCLPVDILCEVWGSGNIIPSAKRYSDGYGGFFSHGCDKFLDGNTESWSNYKIIKNPIRPWFGGQCPIPEGVKFKIYFRNKSVGEGGGNSIAVWTHNEGSPYEDIIAFQILGEE